MPSENFATEHLDNDVYWLHELNSLGIIVKRTNELNDKEELGSLTENIKQTLIQEYKTAYYDDE